MDNGPATLIKEKHSGKECPDCQGSGFMGGGYVGIYCSCEVGELKALCCDICLELFEEGHSLEVGIKR